MKGELSLLQTIYSEDNVSMPDKNNVYVPTGLYKVRLRFVSALLHFSPLTL